MTLKRLTAFLVVLLCLAAEGWADESFLPDKLPILGGSKAYMPSLVTGDMFVGSIFVGLIAGLITGVIGAGGGYILTPALMSFGVRGIMAVGTDQFHLFAKGIMGTTIHRRLGNVNFGLAAWFVLGSLFGVTAGGRISRALFQHSPVLSDAVISSVYVVVLGILGFYALLDCRRERRPAAGGGGEAGFRLARWLQALPLKPRIAFDHDIVPGGRSISVYPVIFCGFVVGFVASIMGVGGGFLTFPMFVYGLGVSTFTTVGTDILQIIFTTFYSSIFQYAAHGFIFYSVSVGMLLGSLVGVQIGAMVTMMVSGSQIRAFYALTILAGFSNRLCALPRKLADLGLIALGRNTAVIIEQVGTVLFFAIVGLFSLWVLVAFFRNVKQERARFQAENGRTGGGLVAKPLSFWTGVAGVLLFSVLLAVGLMPRSDGRTLLSRADHFFNQLAKNSAYNVPAGLKRAAGFEGQFVDHGIRPRELMHPQQIVRVVSASGLTATELEDRRVRVTGALRALAEAALDDADLAFHNEGGQIRRKHGMADPDVLYCWWIVFDGLARRFVQDGKAAEANFCKFITTRVL
ncbi:MAG: sulfite exporter TauE/SafE family protein, partial [Planctomycetes bacterium]|nr:sulfite exporter TauE/SafE family protein [Planctomycetota bacterium]